MTFTADSDGRAQVSAKAKWIAGGDARSVFIHDGPAMHGSAKIACAEFPASGDGDDGQGDDDGEGRQN